MIKTLESYIYTLRNTGDAVHFYGDSKKELANMIEWGVKEIQRLESELAQAKKFHAEALEMYNDEAERANKLESQLKAERERRDRLNEEIKTLNLLLADWPCWIPEERLNPKTVDGISILNSEYHVSTGKRYLKISKAHALDKLQCEEIKMLNDKEKSEILERAKRALIQEINICQFESIQFLNDALALFVEHNREHYPFSSRRD